MRLKRIVPLLCGILFVGVLLTGCNDKKIEFNTVSLEKTEENLVEGEFYQYKDGKVTYLFETKSFRMEECQQFYEEMQGVREQLERYLKIKADKEAAIYVQAKTEYGGSYVIGQSLFLNKRDWDKYRAREWLTQVYYGIRQPWVAVGITANACDNVSMKGNKGAEDYTATIDLKEHYTNSEDLSELVLFGGCMIKSLNYEEDYLVSYETAASLTDFLVKKGLEKELVASEVGAKEKQEWLTSIGVNREYNELGEPLLAKASYSKEEGCDLVVSLEKESFRLATNFFLTSARKMQKLIEANQYARNQASEIIEAYIPELKGKEKEVFNYRTCMSPYTFRWDMDDETKEHEMEGQGHTFNRKTLEYDLRVDRKDLLREISIQALSGWLCMSDDKYWDVSGAFEDQVERMAYEADYLLYEEYSMVKRMLEIEQKNIFAKKDRTRLLYDLRAIYDVDGKDPVFSICKGSLKDATAEQKLSYDKFCSFQYYIGAEYGKDVLCKHLLQGESYESLTGKKESVLIMQWTKYLEGIKEL